MPPVSPDTLSPDPVRDGSTSSSSSAKRPLDLTDDQNGHAEASQPAGFGMSSMIERVHGVVDRSEAPSKRQKTAHVIPSSANIVDLTADDDEEPPRPVQSDELQIVSDNGDEEICLGKIDRASITTWRLPQFRRTGTFRLNWPVIKVKFFRIPGGNKVIDAVDPEGHKFGRVDLRTATAIAQILDHAATNKMRLLAQLESRPREYQDEPGQYVARDLPVTIHLFAPRKMAPGVGKYMIARHVYLLDPTLSLFGFPYENPQQPKRANTNVLSDHHSTLPAMNGASTMNTLPSLSSYPVVGRTMDQVRSEVLSMFDSLTQSEELPEMEQDPSVTTALLSHQKQALHFMYEREKEGTANGLWKTVNHPQGRRTFYNVVAAYETPQVPRPVRGGLLADMMGLGKTLSILALITATKEEAFSFSQSVLSQQLPGVERNSKATLLVCPLSTISNWQEQMNVHLTPVALRTCIFHGPKRTNNMLELIMSDIVLTTYQTLAGDQKNPKGLLRSVNWFRIVLDEAHMIRSATTGMSKAACELYAQRRWAVTGTPVQNRLEDLYALLKFIRLDPFDQQAGFNRYIMTPFKNADPNVLPKIRLLVDTITLRRLKDTIDLPEKTEQIVELDFSKDERALYQHFATDAYQKMKEVMRDSSYKNKAYMNVLRMFLRLRMICAHGRELLSEDDLRFAQGLSVEDAIDLESTDQNAPKFSADSAYEMLDLMLEANVAKCCSCDEIILSATAESTEAADEEQVEEKIVGHMSADYHVFCGKCIEPFLSEILSKADTDLVGPCSICSDLVKAVDFPLKQSEYLEYKARKAELRKNPRKAKQVGVYVGPHTKTLALLQCLREDAEWSAAYPDEPPIKSVVFSSWTSHLDLIGIALEDNGFAFTRLDGTMQRSKRTVALDTFRDDNAVPIMLVSITAGGMGINLTTANKVYVMEPHYNPGVEAQAVDRVHRLGQTRPVLVRRFIMKNSVEEKVVILQNKKKDLADLSMNRSTKMDKSEKMRQRLEDLRSLFR
ncbi:hypothetical protein K402DRAFT_321355 [Aulographum hederae CBS 113979]|uniref:SNF2 family helicase/ATPase-like protein n=1 Tax=Aulographum hederae CBS 113979 TaxID=1176131 RepID=A0A6G1HHP3_9PEZI|nr:hypothetical protein K402DRAFT_321355 [Aulographum hederae CBS 113979]